MASKIESIGNFVKNLDPDTEVIYLLLKDGFWYCGRIDTLYIDAGFMLFVDESGFKSLIDVDSILAVSETKMSGQKGGF